MEFRYGDVAVDGEKLYIAPAEIAGIIEADINTKESKLLVKFPQYELLTTRMNSAICKLGNYIAVAPLLGREFYLYNIKEDSLISLTIDEKEFTNLNKKCLGKRGLFAGSFVFGNCFYFVGYCYTGIVKISIDSARLEVINFDLNKLRAICVSEEIFLGRYIFMKDNCAYISVKYTNMIIKCNLSNNCCEYMELGNNLNIYELCAGDDKVYLLPSNKNNIMWAKLNDLKNINNLNVSFKGSDKNEEPHFLGGIFKAGYVWIFPYFSNMILKLNLNDGSVECVKENLEYQGGYTYTFIKNFDENHICAFNSRECCLEIINVFTHEFQKLYLYFSDNTGKNILEEMLCSSKEHLIKENAISLNNIIAFLKADCKSNLHKVAADNTSIGKIIWDNM